MNGQLFSGARWVSDLFNALADFREFYNLTHAGTTPATRLALDGGVLLWGLRHPDATLIKFRWDGSYQEEVWTREAWEKMTDLQPPFPWNEAGDGVVYP